MLVELYTSRIVLDCLGVEDYGIYNIVAAFIVAFTFITGPLGNATQRFLSFELGRGQKDNLNIVFNLSFYTYIILSLCLLLAIELIGLWYIENVMVLPINRLESAKFAFHFSVLTLFFTLMKTPFESLIIAYERLSFYAYVCIIEGLLKLFNALSLTHFSFDHLRLFSINLLIISIAILLSFFLFFKTSLRDVRLQSIRKIWVKEKFLELVGFTGWSLFGSVASMSANQGINILLNSFFGVVVNAATGVSNQISAAVNRFVGSFQVAFRPQIVKYYASNNIKDLINLIIDSSKISYLLVFAVVCPACFNMQYILNLWLIKPPEYAAEFSVFMLIYALQESLSAPMWMTIQATGKIKKYQIVISSVMLLNICLSYLFLKFGYPPKIVFIIKCFLDVAYLIVRLSFLHALIRFSFIEYVKRTILPILVVSTISLAVMLLIKSYLLRSQMGLSFLICSTSLFLLIYTPLSLFVGLSNQNRRQVKKFLLKKIHRS